MVAVIVSGRGFGMGRNVCAVSMIVSSVPESVPVTV